MLAAHTRVASPGELHIFSRYAKQWIQIWESQLGWQWTHDEDRTPTEFQGLPSVITEDEFDALITRMVDELHQQILAMKPFATTLLLKDPNASVHVDLVTRYVDQPKFIHLVRDGRDVADSLMAASKAWGRGWAPSSVRRGASMWRRHVEAARAARSSGRPYVEVRYEDLLSAEGPRLLSQLFSFCEVDTSPELCSEIYRAFEFNQMAAKGLPPESLVWRRELASRPIPTPVAPSFFRTGTSGAWGDWGQRAIWEFDSVAGDLLLELGYAEPGWVDVGSMRRLSYLLLRLGRSGVSDALRALRSLTRKHLPLD